MLFVLEVVVVVVVSDTDRDVDIGEEILVYIYSDFERYRQEGQSGIVGAHCGEWKALVELLSNIQREKTVNTGD